MAKAYSLDLRKKVLAYLARGKTQIEAAELFEISIRTVRRWVNRDKLGKLSPDDNKIRAPRKLDPEILKEYILRHPDATLKEIGKKFNAAAPSVRARLCKLGITYKKKNSYIKSETKKEGKNFKKVLSKKR